MSNELAEKVPSHLRSLADLGKSGHLNMRPVLFRVVCDLFVLRRHHSPDELTQFGEMALRMMAELDASLIAPVAERLAQHPETPAAVLKHLAGRGDAIAIPVLRHANGLDREILIDAANYRSESAAAAIAQRASLDPELTQVLSERPEEAILVALLGNRDARFSPASQALLVRRARHLPAVAAVIAQRDDFVDDLTPLFLWAPSAHRARMILEARRINLAEIGRPSPSAAQEAERLRIERLAIAKQWDACVASLAAALGCGADQAHLLLQDPTGEPLALSLCALGINAEASARIFMSLGPSIAHSADRVHALTDLVLHTPGIAAARLVQAMLSLPATRPTPNAKQPKPLASRPATFGMRDNKRVRRVAQQDLIQVGRSA